ncbi:MAG TPA: acyloxyacyl hydrolase [Terriglobia bacterium]|jgi:opacity protein-like surface antigen|nr:acyloxyacyl hydrolase [Terriglobia bacterium]
MSVFGRIRDHSLFKGDKKPAAACTAQPAREGSALLGALFSLIGLFCCGRLPAQESAPPRDAAAQTLQPSPDRNQFWTPRSRFNFGLQVAYAMENNDRFRNSHINLLYAQPQLGIAVTDFHARRLPLSRFEIINEGVLGNSIHPGGRLTGYVLLFRFDGKPWGRTVPFFDMGAGVLNTTLNLKAPELSGSTQFNPQAGLGIQYFFKPHWAFVLEYRYLHMSNNNIQEPNLGFNASMFSLGFRWLPRPRSAASRGPRHSHNLVHRVTGAS